MDNDETRDPLDDTPETPETVEVPASDLPEDYAAGDVALAAPIVPGDAPEVDVEDAPPEDSAEVEQIGAVIGEPAPEANEAEAFTAAELEAEPGAGATVIVDLEDAEAESEVAEDVPEIPVSYDLPQALFDAGIDVDAALGALSFELASGGYDDAHAAPPRLPPFTPSTYRPKLRMPASLRLHRGQIGSVLPALLLIGLGAWLTLTNASDAPVDPVLVGLVLVGGLMVSFVAEWLFSGRWARGLLLVALLVLFGAGGAALVLQSGADIALVAYPLLLSALGLAVILSGLLARPVERIMLGPGMVFITAGIVGFLVLDGVIPATVLSAAAAYWFVPAAIVALLLLLPLIFRKPS